MYRLVHWGGAEQIFDGEGIGAPWFPFSMSAEMKHPAPKLMKQQLDSWRREGFEPYLNAGDVGALLCTATEIVRRVIRLPPFRNIELAAYRGGVKTNSRTLAPEGKGATRVKFHHTGWPEQNEHWRVSCFCWTMYLRIPSDC